MIRVKEYFFLSLVLLLSGSCRPNYGHKLESDELVVFFEKKEDEKFARTLGEYWKKKNFLSAKKQFIQLNHTEDVFYLNLISSNPTDINQLSYDERKLLLDFQENLKDSVFEGKEIELVLSNSNFEPIYNINQ